MPLDTLGLGALTTAIADGELSSVEAVGAALDRIDASQDTLNAFRVVRRDEALAEAETADRRRADGARAPLLGVPVAIKDDTDLTGTPTAFGCGGSFPVRTADAEVARRLRAAGAVIVGKANTCELGQWPFTDGAAFGYTRNPWHREHTPGGSSGGSAAAVAAGLVPAAIGSDGAGSVRIPASWTNLVGIKPQRGRISTWPDAEAFHGITVHGPLARTVADAALLLDLAAGNHVGDRHRPPTLRLREAVGRDPGRLRVAIALDPPFMAVPVELDAQVAAGVTRIADALRGLGHEVEVAELPYPKTMGAAFLPRATSGVADWLAGMPRTTQVDPRTRSNARTGRLLSGPILRAARRAEAPIARRVGRIFGDASGTRGNGGSYDVVLTPTTATPPPPVRAMDGLGPVDTDRLIIGACPYTWPWNLLGWPGVNVPAGFTDTGLPIGAQLLGPVNSEVRLVALAAQLETELRWAEQRPEPWWATAER